MQRPRLLRLLPPRLRQTAYYRYYHHRHSAWGELFVNAPLALCPRMTMHGLLPGDVISGNIAFNGFYELQLSRLIALHARGGGLFVDVGANMGYFTLLWAGLGAGEVVAVEPAARNIALLAENIARNGLSGRVQLVPKAAGDHDGVAGFRIGPTEQTGWGGIAAEGIPPDLTVPSIRLDHALGAREIAVMKIDVEGSEDMVLRGCEALLRGRHIGRVYFEQNEPRMRELGLRAGASIELLRDFGYDAAPLSRARTEWVAVPRRVVERA